MAKDSSSQASAHVSAHAGKRETSTLRDYIAVARGADLVVIRVVGRGNMLNAPALAEFADKQRKAGFTRFVFDLERCLGLDSTFMGVMVGIHSGGDSRSPLRFSATPTPPATPTQIPATAAAATPVTLKGGETVALTPEEAARELSLLFSAQQPPETPSKNAASTAATQGKDAQTGSVMTSVSAVNVSSEVKALMAMLGVDTFVRVRGSADLKQLEVTILPEKPLTPDDRRRLILKAHETLVDIDRRNEAQFGNFLRTLASELGQ
jgi:hypothetical protein